MMARGLGTGMTPSIDEQQIFHEFGMSGMVGGINHDVPLSSGPLSSPQQTAFPGIGVGQQLLEQSRVPITGPPTRVAQAPGDGGHMDAVTEDTPGQGFQAPFVRSEQQSQHYQGQGSGL